MYNLTLEGPHALLQLRVTHLFYLAAHQTPLYSLSVTIFLFIFDKLEAQPGWGQSFRYTRLSGIQIFDILMSLTPTKGGTIFDNWFDCFALRIVALQGDTLCLKRDSLLAWSDLRGKRTVLYVLAYGARLVDCRKLQRSLLHDVYSTESTLRKLSLSASSYSFCLEYLWEVFRIIFLFYYHS